MAPQVTGRLSRRREKLLWPAGPSFSFIVGTPLGQKCGCPDDVSGPHCHTRGMCPRLHTHTRAQPACSPTSMRGSCAGLTGQAGGEKPGHGKDCSFPACSVPTSPPPALPVPAQPRTCSLVLTHTIRLLARPRFICGPSWKVACFPAGGIALFERGFLQWAEGPYLSEYLLPPLLLAQKSPGGPPKCT